MDARKEVPSSEPLALRPCQHQVAGHLFEAGKAGSLVDDLGHFYKPLQPGPRGERELAFYKRLFQMVGPSSLSSVEHSDAASDGDAQGEVGSRGEDGESERTDAILEFVPRFLGTIETGGRTLLMLKDVGASYSKPCVIDIKIGYRTWYASADERYIARARAKDQATTQASLGFKICGWQVYKHSKGKICRASKSYCKTMSDAQVEGAFLDFADNERGIRPESVFGMTSGALPQLLNLRSWFQHQTLFHFYSSSILIFYEGLATAPENLNVRVSMVDFAHTFPGEGNWDDNFLGGLTSLIGKLQSISEDRSARKQKKRAYRKRSLSNGDSVGLSGWLGRPAMASDRILGDGVPTPISSGGET